MNGEIKAYTRILENNKFIFTEIVQDEKIGDALLLDIKSPIKRTNCRLTAQTFTAIYGAISLYLRCGKGT
jgi:hypothetical protein